MGRPGTRASVWLGADRRWGLAGGALALVWFSLLSLARWNLGRATSYDLAIFSQSAQSWSRGELPRSFVRGPDVLLADHFSPLTAVFALPWRLWPDPRSLLLTQALCLAIAVGILTAVAHRRLGPRAAALVIASGLLGRALVSGATFDVHEVALTVPLLAVVVVGLLERRPRAVLVACLLLLLVKEDLGLTVGAVGLVWWWRGRGDDARRAAWQGAGLCVLGAAGLLLAVAVIGWANPHGGSSYLDYFTGGSGERLAGSSTQPVSGLHLVDRLQPLLWFTLMTAVVGWRSPVVWVAAPTLLWRTVSSNPSYWATGYHYDMVLWPVAAGAALEGWVLLRRRGSSRSWVRPTAAVVVVLATLVTCLTGPDHLRSRSTSPLAAFSRSDRLERLDRLVAGLPPGSVVAAESTLGPYLVARHHVTMLGLDRPERVRHVVLADDTAWAFQAPACARRRLVQDAERTPGTTVRRVGELVLLTLPTARPAGLRRCAR